MSVGNAGGERRRRRSEGGFFFLPKKIVRLFFFLSKKSLGRQKYPLPHQLFLTVSDALPLFAKGSIRVQTTRYFFGMRFDLALKILVKVQFGPK